MREGNKPMVNMPRRMHFLSDFDLKTNTGTMICGRQGVRTTDTSPRYAIKRSTRSDFYDATNIREKVTCGICLRMLEMEEHK